MKKNPDIKKESDITFYIDTYGCAKNQVDSEYLITLLESLGLKYCSDENLCDAVLINSCGFIDCSTEESLNAVTNWKKDFPNKIIILCGCVPSRKGLDELTQALPGILAVDNRDLKTSALKIAAIIKERLSESKLRTKIKKDDLKEKVQDPPLPYIARNVLLSNKGSAFVKVAEGCSNHCTFCAIPLIRGELKSRPLDSVFIEVADLVARGIFEINLVAQDLGSYGVDLTGRQELVPLLKKIMTIPGHFWIRLLYIHPDNFPPNLIDCCKEDKRLLPYFDIPFQSGSDKIIKEMGRKGDALTYTQFVKDLKKELPSAIIRTTFLVGFPYEEEEDFRATLAFLKEIEPLWSGSFVFSAQSGTRAYEIPNRISSTISEHRVELLQKEQEKITKKLLQKFVGKTLEVIIEDNVGEGCYIGRAWVSAPDVDGSVVLDSSHTLKAGDIVKAKITATAGLDLVAVVL